MTIRFKKGYLAVGHRLKDWTIVWFKPHGDLQEDGSYATLTLYKCLKDSSENLFREPMADEVSWFPWYDWKTMPTATSSAKSKQRIQLEFISDAWRYCNEKERNASDVLEHELGNLGDSRWVAWLTEAKKWKKGGYKRTIENNPQADPTIMDDASSEDSAYESDPELRAATRKAARSMPPPPRPARNSRKRKQGNNRGKPDDFDPRTKRSRTSPLFMSDNGRLPSFSSHRSGSFGSPSLIDGHHGEDPYAADEDDDMESTVSHSKPSRLGSFSNAGASLSRTRASSCGIRESPIEVDSYRGDDGLGSMPPSPTGYGSRRPSLTPRPRDPGIAALTTTGNRSTSRDTVHRRDERGSSVVNPVTVDNADDDDEVRLPGMTIEEAEQRVRTYHAETYQPLNLTDEEAIAEAVRQSIAPENALQPGEGAEDQGHSMPPNDVSERGEGGAEEIRADEAEDLPDGVRPSTEEAD
ncbi:hypothetical protein EJ03DRAFT_50365 [Teratosphaeria nubilosa]|uniref:Uncharacterized protein n=1 Tax=Teratosphaeria nubilosa TaxID=161662 RepID=A0A6G1LEP8_9PEZI|nr:hypothetical protein EJ03DRAFT_50365 [Teratosphaeria nubilosa]